VKVDNEDRAIILLQRCQGLMSTLLLH
jgi:hypothetical protein